MPQSKKRVVICIAGKQGAGKSTLARYIQNLIPQSTIVKVSDVLVQSLVSWNIPTSTGNLQKLSDLMSSTFGKETLGKIVASRVENTNSSVVIVDGVRGPNVFGALQSSFPTHLIYVECGAQIRRNRITKRNEKESDALLTQNDFLVFENHRSEKGTDALKSIADIIVNTEHGKTLPNEQIGIFISNILK